MTLPRLSVPAARAAALLSARDQPPLAEGDEPAFLELLASWRLAGEIAALAPPSLSVALRRRLALERERQRVQAAPRLATLARCAQALDAAGAEALLYKGEAVRQLTHGDESRRPMADIDLLARAGQVDAVVAALVACGFERTRHDTSLHVVLRDDERGARAAAVHVEIHADVFPPPHPFRLDLAGVHARAGRGAGGLLLPTRADAVVLSAIHLVFHEHDAHKTLSTLRDVALLLDAMADAGEDVARVRSLAASSDVGDVVRAVVERSVAWAGASPAALAGWGSVAASRRRTWALRWALAEMDSALRSAGGSRWRALGRRIGVALWWRGTADSARACLRLVAGRAPRALASAAARQARAILRAAR